MSSTVPQGPSVPMTDGFTAWVPTPGVEIWCIPHSGGGTLDVSQPPKRVYPVPTPESESEKL